MVCVLMVQSTFVEKFALFDVRPDLVLLILVYVALSGGHIEGTLLGFFAGFLQDVYAPGHFGLNALAKSIVGFTVGYGHGSIVIENILTRGLILFGAAFGHDVFYFVFYHRGDWGSVLFSILRYGLPTALYTMLLGVGISILFSRAMGRKVHLYAKERF